MNILGIIPARYASTRFPGKPLVDIHGKTMIQHVYEQAAKALKMVVVATDDERIQETVLKFGGKVVMTSSDHASGTDRCAEAVQLYEHLHGLEIDVVVNIQGDEPFIDPAQISQLADLFSDPDVEIATLIKSVDNSETLFNPNKPKVIVNNRMEAIYFSRAAIPYLRGVEPDEWVKNYAYFQHIGMYGYRKEILLKLTRLKKGNLENAESLEQLRWIESGYAIKTGVTTTEGISIDTPEDLEKVLNQLIKK